MYEESSLHSKTASFLDSLSQLFHHLLFTWIGWKIKPGKINTMKTLEMGREHLLKQVWALGRFPGSTSTRCKVNNLGPAAPVEPWSR